MACASVRLDTPTANDSEKLGRVARLRLMANRCGIGVARSSRLATAAVLGVLSVLSCSPGQARTYVGSQSFNRLYQVQTVVKVFAASGITLYRTVDSPPIFSSQLVQPGHYGINVTVYPNLTLARTIFKRDHVRWAYRGYLVREIRNVEVLVIPSADRRGAKRQSMRAVPPIVMTALTRLRSAR